MRWPFPDEQAFWQWAMDADAELDDHDEDLLLHHVAGLNLLVAAADTAACPKREYCCRVLEDYASVLIGGTDGDAFAALQAAARSAAAGMLPGTRRWAAYTERLLTYRHPRGPVNRSAAEQMAADLLSGPSRQEQMRAAGRSDWLNVHVTASGHHWRCICPDPYLRQLYINRRTGAWRRVSFRPLSAEELAAL